MQSKNGKRQSNNDILLRSTDHKPKQHLEWQQIKTPSMEVGRRSCHSSCLHNNQLYIYGGYDSNTNGIHSDMFSYSFTDSKWKKVQQKGQLPGPRHSHTTIIYNQKILMFGGMYDTMDNTNKVHLFDLKQGTWKQIQTISQPKSIDSHKAVVYGQEMIVGLGYSEGEYNPNIYALNLNTLTWRTIFNPKEQKDKQYPQARAQGSMNVWSSSLIIYGGKNFNTVFSDCWLFDLKNESFKKIQLINHLQGRFGHSGVIYDNHLFIFGGTKGVTHERNDLISIDLSNGNTKIFWIDSQQQRLKKKEEEPNIKKNCRDSASKVYHEQAQIQQYDHQSNTKCLAKYRNQLKEVNYYNQLYENKRQQLHDSKKKKKNRLLTEFDSLQSNQTLNLTSTFEVLTNSILLIAGVSHKQQEKNESNVEATKKKPKSRDNYTADLYLGTRDQMVIFGGGMHKISYNDIVLIDLKSIHSKSYTR